MAVTTITRSTIVDDDGTGTTGDVWGSVLLGTAVYDKIDALIAADLEWGGDQIFPKAVILSGIISPAQITANQDNYNPTSLANAGILRLSSDAARDITGIVAQETGRVILLANVGAFALTLKHEVTSTAANRFDCPSAADVTLNARAVVLIVYDGTTARWRVLSGGTGGGDAFARTYLATDNQPPASAYATPDTRNIHPVLDFDGATDEEAVFSDVLPAGYGGGGLTVTLFVAFTSAIAGTSRWQAAIERMDASSLDIDADSFAAFQSNGVAAPGTTGQIVTVAITFTAGAQMDSLAAGEAFRLKVRRDADGTSGTDDITTDAELLRVQVTET